MPGITIEDRGLSWAQSVLYSKHTSFSFEVETSRDAKIASIRNHHGYKIAQRHKQDFQTLRCAAKLLRHLVAERMMEVESVEELNVYLAVAGLEVARDGRKFTLKKD